MFALIEIVLMIVLFAVAASFSMIETALVSLSRVKIKKFLTEYPKKMNGFKIWLENPNKYLTTLLLGNDAVTIIGTAIATSIATEISRRYNLNTALIIGITAIFVWATFLVLGEIAPKIIGIRHSEKISLFCINKLYYFDRFVSPISKLFTRLAIMVTGKSGKKEIPILTAEDVRTMVSVGHTEGIFGKDTKDMIHLMLDFGNKKVKDIMTPRESIDAVDIKIEQEKFIDLVIETGHTRVPIYRDNIDNIVGIICARDLLNEWRYKDLFVTSDLLREPLFVYPDMKVNELLREFKKGIHHMAIIRDQNNKTLGLLTLEDLLEEIVGEILDEYDVEDRKI